MADSESPTEISQSQKPLCRLLSIPAELREQIWALHYGKHEMQVRATMTAKDDTSIKTYITTRTFALRVTCRQIYEETEKYWKPDDWRWTLFTASQTKVNLLTVLKLLPESRIKELLPRITKAYVTIPMHEAISPYSLSIKDIWSKLRKALVAVKTIEIMCPRWDNSLTEDDAAILYNGSSYRYPDYRMYTEHFFNSGFDVEFSWPAEKLRLHSLVKDMEWTSRDCKVYLTTLYYFAGSIKPLGPLTSRREILGNKEKIYHWDSVRFQIRRDSVKKRESSRHYHEYSREIFCKHCRISKNDRCDIAEISTDLPISLR